MPVSLYVVWMRLSQRLESEMHLITSSILSLPSPLAHISPWITRLKLCCIWNPECVQRGSRVPKLRDKVIEGSWPWPTQRSRDSKGTVTKLSLWTANKDQGWVGGSSVWQRGNEPEKGVTPLLHGLPPLPGGITPPFTSTLAPPEPPAAPSSRKRMHETLPHTAPPVCWLNSSPTTFRSSCLCCHLVSLFIFSPDFGSFYSAGLWQGINSIILGSEKIIVQAWPQALRGQSASVGHLMPPLHPPGQSRGAGVPHRPAGSMAMNMRKRQDLRFHLAQPSLSNGETEIQRTEPWVPSLSMKVIESDPNPWALFSLMLCPIH